MKITDNITATVASYGRYAVKDLTNDVTVDVPAWLVDECDTDDEESVDRLLNYCRQNCDTHYNIIIDLGSKGERYMIDDNGEWSVDPLPFRTAYEAAEVPELLAKARDLYCGAYSEEVKPFEY